MSAFDGLAPAALEAARLAVEDRLIELRDARIGILGRGNGFVVREADGQESSVMRLGTIEGLAIGIAAYLAAFPEGYNPPSPFAKRDNEQG